jgi:hypothetical protein
MRVLQVVIGGVFVAALILVGIARTQRHPSHALQSAHASEELLELQSECLDQAELQVQREGKNSKKSNQAFTYTDHYSIRLAECFLVTRQRDQSADSLDNRMHDIRLLSDPFEDRDFARFEAVRFETGSASVVRQCVLTPRAGSSKSCHSAEEWERLVGEFMR